jgi:hypothetical protein
MNERSTENQTNAESSKYTRSDYFADKAIKLRNQFADDRRFDDA